MTQKQLDFILIIGAMIIQSITVLDMYIGPQTSDFLKVLMMADLVAILLWLIVNIILKHFLLEENHDTIEQKDC